MPPGSRRSRVRRTHARRDQALLETGKLVVGIQHRPACRALRDQALLETGKSVAAECVASACWGLHRLSEPICVPIRLALPLDQPERYANLTIFATIRAPNRTYRVDQEGFGLRPNLKGPPTDAPAPPPSRTGRPCGVKEPTRTRDFHPTEVPAPARRYLAMDRYPEHMMRNHVIRPSSLS
jgi:hypothetical protein